MKYISKQICRNFDIDCHGNIGEIIFNLDLKSDDIISPLPYCSLLQNNNLSHEGFIF